MKALRYWGPGDVRLDEVPKPAIQHPEDIILKVTTTTVCGTDLHPYRGTKPEKAGRPMGHECVGIVEAVGERVKHVQVGERVLVAAFVSCGYCAYCTEGYHALCVTEGAGTIHGAQAEFVRVPFATVSVLSIPEELSDEAALTLTDIFPTGYFGTVLADVHAGEAVAVFGAGPVGLFAMRSAQLKGASRIFAVDNDGARLGLAASEGFHPIDFSGQDPVQAIKELTGGYGADACIEAVGVDALGRKGVEDPVASVRWCVEALKKGGQIGVLGVFPEPLNGFPLHSLFQKNATFRAGVCHHRHYIPHLMQILQQGLFDPTFVYTGETDLENFEEAYQKFDRHEHIKLIVRTAAGRQQHGERGRLHGVRSIAWEPKTEAAKKRG